MNQALLNHSSFSDKCLIRETIFLFVEIAWNNLIDVDFKWNFFFNQNCQTRNINLLFQKNKNKKINLQ